MIDSQTHPVLTFFFRLSYSVRFMLQLLEYQGPSRVDSFQFAHNDFFFFLYMQYNNSKHFACIELLEFCLDLRVGTEINCVVLCCC